jgi:ADP-ribose pyrophosphatase YjhB (NUDIX family)
MSTLAVNVAVIQDDKILLKQREGFETWILPGGSIEVGESIAQAAIRETKEETGLDVQLTGLAGIYSRLGNFLGGHVVLFTGRSIGGEIKCQAGEIIEVRWFPFDKIPSPLSLGHKRWIEDVIYGIRGVCIRQEFNLPNHSKGMDRRGLYKLRDNSVRSRQDFTLKWTEGATYDEKVEVGDV